MNNQMTTQSPETVPNVLTDEDINRAYVKSAVAADLEFWAKYKFPLARAIEQAVLAKYAAPATVGVPDDEVVQIFADVCSNDEDGRTFIDVSRDEAIQIGRRIATRMLAASPNPPPEEGQEPVAWLDPEASDVITQKRKHEWEQFYGEGGKRKAKFYTVALIKADLVVVQSSAQHASKPVQDERERFETWMSERDFQVERCGESYRPSYAARAWEAWRAGAKYQSDRVAELEAEVQEQCRVNGMGSEREARLMARVAELEKAGKRARMALAAAAERDPSFQADYEAIDAALLEKGEG